MSESEGVSLQEQAVVTTGKLNKKIESTGIDLKEQIEKYKGLVSYDPDFAEKAAAVNALVSSDGSPEAARNALEVIGNSLQSREEGEAKGSKTPAYKIAKNNRIALSYLAILGLNFPADIQRLAIDHVTRAYEIPEARRGVPEGYGGLHRMATQVIATIAYTSEDPDVMKDAFNALATYANKASSTDRFGRPAAPIEEKRYADEAIETLAARPGAPRVEGTEGQPSQ